MLCTCAIRATVYYTLQLLSVHGLLQSQSVTKFMDASRQVVEASSLSLPVALAPAFLCVSLLDAACMMELCV